MDAEHDPDEIIAELRRRLRETEEILDRRTQELGLLRLERDALAMADVATGLLNRAGLLDAIEEALQRLDRLGESFALIGIRSDALLEARALHPSAAGDALRHVSAMLRAGLRALDRIGRLDADTFVVVAPLLGKGDPMVPINRVRSLLSAAPPIPGEVDDVRYALIEVTLETRADPPALLARLLDGLVAEGR